MTRQKRKPRPREEIVNDRDRFEHLRVMFQDNRKALGLLEEVEDSRMKVVIRLYGAEEALKRIVDFPINESLSAGYHFAEVRKIARDYFEADRVSS